MAPQTIFRLQKAQLEAIKKHIDDQPEVEVCGLIGGLWQPYDRLAVVGMVLPIPNIDPQPHLRFRMSAKAQINAIFDFQMQLVDLIGIYHSHPYGEPIPSSSDIAEAGYPDAVYLIGVPNGEVRGWRLQQGQAREVILQIEEPD